MPRESEAPGGAIPRESEAPGGAMPRESEAPGGAMPRESEAPGGAMPPRDDMEEPIDAPVFWWRWSATDEQIDVLLRRTWRGDGHGNASRADLLGTPVRAVLICAAAMQKARRGGPSQRTRRTLLAYEADLARLGGYYFCSARRILPARLVDITFAAEILVLA